LHLLDPRFFTLQARCFPRRKLAGFQALLDSLLLVMLRWTSEAADCANAGVAIKAVAALAARNDISFMTILLGGS